MVVGASCIKETSMQGSLLSNRYIKKEYYYIKGIKDRIFQNDTDNIYSKIFYIPLIHNEKVIVAKVKLENLSELTGAAIS